MSQENLLPRGLQFLNLAEYVSGDADLRCGESLLESGFVLSHDDDFAAVSFSFLGMNTDANQLFQSNEEEIRNRIHKTGAGSPLQGAYSAAPARPWWAQGF
jgi:hypothetical protein